MAGPKPNKKLTFMFAWPSAKIAVMGGEQAAKTLTQIKLSNMGDVDDKTKTELYEKIKSLIIHGFALMQRFFCSQLFLFLGLSKIALHPSLML